MQNIGDTGRDSTSDSVGDYAITINESKEYVAFIANGEERSRRRIINREDMDGSTIYLLNDYKGDNDILVVTKTEAIVLFESTTIRYVLIK